MRTDRRGPPHISAQTPRWLADCVGETVVELRWNPLQEWILRDGRRGASIGSGRTGDLYRIDQWGKALIEGVGLLAQSRRRRVMKLHARSCTVTDSYGAREEHALHVSALRRTVKESSRLSSISGGPF